MGWQTDRNEWPSQVTSIVAVFIVGGFLKQNVSEIKLANTGVKTTHITNIPSVVLNLLSKPIQVQYIDCQ